MTSRIPTVTFEISLNMARCVPKFWDNSSINMARPKKDKEKNSLNKHSQRSKQAVKSVIVVPKDKRKRKSDKELDQTPLSTSKKCKQTTPKINSESKKDTKKVVVQKKVSPKEAKEKPISDKKKNKPGDTEVE